jgi:integrase
MCPARRQEGAVMITINVNTHPARPETKGGETWWYVKYAMPSAPRKVLRQRVKGQPGTAVFLANHKAACKLAQDHVIRLSGGTPQAEPTAADRLTLQHLITEFLIWKKKQVGASTFYRYDLTLNKHLAQRAKTKAGLPRGICAYDELLEEHLVDLMDAWAERGAKLAWQRITYIREMYDWAMGRIEFKKAISANPCAGIKPPKRQRKPEGEQAEDGTLPWEEKKQIAQWRRAFDLGTEARTLIELGVLGGLRRSDLARLGPSNINRDDPEGWVLEWTEHKYREAAPKKRSTLVFTELREAIEAFEAAHPDAQYFAELDRVRVSKNKIGTLLDNQLDVKFRGWREQAGVDAKFTMHGWRAGGACRLALLGWNDNQIAGWGGWTSTKHVATYTRHLRRGEMANEAIRAYNQQARRPALRVVGGGR